MGNMRIDDYIAEIDKIWRTGGATEHSYRGALQRLLADLMPGLTVLNEPRRIACGAPDYTISRRGVPVAFVEAKDIGDADLDGRKASGHKEQFDRYKDSLSAIAFTDYLDFHLYLDGRLAESVRIGEPRGDGIAATGDTLERFLHLVECLANAAPRKITSAPQLVRLMAGRARLLQQAASRFLRDPPPPLSEKTAAFPVAGTNLVEETRFFQNRVYINGAQYFDNVPEEAWECLIGGYQPAQKWLKDRKGRALSAADLLHYKRIILALLRTIRLVAEAQLTI